MTDEALLAWIGERLARQRLARNLTQAQVAEQAGLGLRTVQRLEQGAVATQLSGLVRVCRVLGLVENFERLVPEVSEGPIAQWKQKGHSRQRASGEGDVEGGAQPWSWGEAGANPTDQRSEPRGGGQE